MHAVGAGVDETGQGVGVGRFQLGELAPVDDLARQLVAFGGKIFQQLRRGRPLAGLGLRAARQAHLAEQDVTELLRRADVDALADQAVDFLLQAGSALRQFAGEPRQNLAVDRDAALFHPGQHRHQRPLQPFIDRDQALGGQPRLQHLP
jgi:hypothetical protein